MIALLFGQSDALAEEIDGGITHKRTVEFVETEALFKLLPANSLLEGLTGNGYLCLPLSHIAR
jgi:hypothetical protein